MTRATFKLLDLPSFADEPLDEMVNYLNKLNYSAVKTKFNKKEQWQAISIRGYSDDISNILKPGVLDSNIQGQGLMYTHLYEQPECAPIKQILWHIPANFERIRIMRLRAGTKISKHTDKVDKEIKNGNIIRIHAPLKTNEKVKMYLWEDKNKIECNLQQGRYYYTDVSKPHAVTNDADFDRLHLVIDCFINEKLEGMINEISMF